MKPAKRGDYVQIEGRLYPVTGKRQRLLARMALAKHPRSTGEICRWNGRQWTDTGEVLSPAPAAHPQDPKCGCDSCYQGNLQLLGAKG